MANGLVEIDEKLPTLREKFAEIYAANINNNAYHEKDLERIRTEDIHLRNYLRHQKGIVEKAAAMMDVSLRFRNDLKLNDLTENSFSRELHEIGACYYHNTDKDGHKILYFRVSKNKKDPERLTLVKQFVAWWIDKHYLQNPEESIVVLFDMTDAGFANMDMELIKYQISCFTTYFPALLEYMLIYEMPWVLNAIWKVIKTILTPEQQKRVIFVKKPDIKKYITQDQLWQHMGGDDTYEYSYMPSEDSGIEILNGDGDSPTEEVPSSNIGSNCDASKMALKKKVTFADKDQMMYTSFDAEDDSESAAPQPPTSNQTRQTKIIYKPPSNVVLTQALQRRTQKDDAYVGPLLTISPGEELDFCVTDDGRESLDILSLSNNTGGHVAFKVKTTSPEKYRVRPSTGVVKPNGSAEISVYLHPGHHGSVIKDKFLVMYMEVNAETSSLQVNDLFKTASRDKYIEHRLRCKLGQPKAAGSDEPKTEMARLQDAMSKLTHQVQLAQIKGSLYTPHPLPAHSLHDNHPAYAHHHNNYHSYHGSHPVNTSHYQDSRHPAYHGMRPSRAHPGNQSYKPEGHTPTLAGHHGNQFIASSYRDHDSSLLHNSSVSDAPPFISQFSSHTLQCLELSDSSSPQDEITLNKASSMDIISSTVASQCRSQSDEKHVNLPTEKNPNSQAVALNNLYESKDIKTHLMDTVKSPLELAEEKRLNISGSADEKCHITKCSLESEEMSCPIKSPSISAKEVIYPVKTFSESADELSCPIKSSLQNTDTSIYITDKVVESLTKTNSRLERRLSQMFTFQLLMFFILIVVVVGFSLMYWLDYIPLNRYTVNACIPYHLS